MSIKQDSEKQKSFGKLRNINAKKGLIAFLIIVLVCVIAKSFTHQKQEIQDLNNTNNSLHSTVSKLTSQNKSLMSQKTNLTKSYNALKNEQTSKKTSATINASSSTTPVEVVTATATIVKVQNKIGADFGNTLPDAANTELIAVTVAMKNLTSTNQNFNLGNFHGVTETGAIRGPIGWALGTPGVGNFWNNSNIAPGGTDTQVLTFFASDNPISIQFDAPVSHAITIIPIPAPSN